MSILALAKRSLKEVARRHEWPELIKEDTFSTANGTAAYSLATDIDEPLFLTWWNQTDNRQLVQVNAHQWQDLQSSSFSSGFRTWYFFKQGSSNDLTVNLYPTPTATETISYYYRSNNICQSSGGTGQATWVADTDTAIIPEDLITLDLIWRWKSSQGIEYAEAKQDFETALARAKALYNSPVVDLGRRKDVIYDNIPDNGWLV